MKKNKLFLVLSMLLCSTLVTSCTIRRAPSSEAISSEEPSTQVTTSEEPNSEEITSEEPSLEEVTSEEISSEEISSEDQVTSEIPSTSEESSSEDQVTSEEISSEEPSSEENNTETCKMTIGGEEYELTIKTDSDMSDGKLYEYEIKGVTVSAKDVVVFYINDEVVGTDVLGTGTSGGNNIKIDGDKFVIRQDATANVYFKVYESGYSVWVSGYEDTIVYDFYLRGSFTNWNADNDYAFVHHDEDEVKLENVTLKAGDKFKVVQNNDASNHQEWWHGFDTVKDGCKNLVTDDKGDIVIKDSGTYTFYWDWDDFQLWIAKTA